MNYNQSKNCINTFNSMINGNIYSRDNEDVEIIGNVEIAFVQGDNFTKIISIEDIDNRIIEGIYFTCKDLNICKKCIFYKEEYILEFTSEETEKIKPYIGTYDLTIRFVKDEVITICHNTPFIVLTKKNEVTCNE